jgi:hypothetical protein
MLKNFIVFFGLLGVAFSILFLSVLRSASVKYNIPPHLADINSAIVLGDSITIDYNLPNPGTVMPDSPFWSVKAVRDKVWYAITTNSGREADLLLLFSDKRLASGRMLVEKGKTEEGYAALVKSDMYLKEAWNKEQENRLKEINTVEFLQNLNLSALKHFEILQNLISLIPENMQPGIVEMQGSAINIYNLTAGVLNQKGEKFPQNPFDWE